MEILTLGLVVFFTVHLFTGARQARERLIARLGEKAYKGLYSLLALLGLVLIIWGKARAPLEPFWEPPTWGRHLAMSLMPLAFISLAASHMATNLKRFTAHPMLWGIALWATLHLLANGDRASVALFGSFALYAAFAMLSQTQRGVRPTGKPVPLIRDVVVVIAGLIITTAFALAHGWLFGMPITGAPAL